MSVVLDSSVTLALIFGDAVYGEEITPALYHVLDLVRDQGAWVPSLWRLEVANGLEMSVRKGRTNSKFRDKALSDLAQLPIRLDAETDNQAWGATLKLASRHRLTLYDAAFLELALRRALPLATLDRDLIGAGRREGVPLLGI